ncbi:peptidoglycan-binding protein [Streptosporangium sp. NPDC051022]|uniref:peptidoglycan-binding domain-containing protein n=1 Tax=Streptosporangium sp. NPDC051022 TaxID=3155752 RepID=UPI00343B5146
MIKYLAGTVAVSLGVLGFAAPVPTGGRHLRPGDYSQPVERLQRRLQKLRFAPGLVNGYYGAETQSAVWAFQKSQGLELRDGVGQETWRALARPRTLPPLIPDGEPRRVEIDLDRQLLIVYRERRPMLISHVTVGDGASFCQYGGSTAATTPVGDFSVVRRVPHLGTDPLASVYETFSFESGPRAGLPGATGNEARGGGPTGETTSAGSARSAGSAGAAGFTGATGPAGSAGSVGEAGRASVSPTPAPLSGSPSPAPLGGPAHPVRPARPILLKLPVKPVRWVKEPVYALPPVEPADPPRSTGLSPSFGPVRHSGRSHPVGPAPAIGPASTGASPLFGGSGHAPTSRPSGGSGLPAGVIPTTGPGSYAVPSPAGRPAYGCVRVPSHVAERIFRLVEVGDPVHVRRDD